MNNKFILILLTTTLLSTTAFAEPGLDQMPPIKNSPSVKVEKRIIEVPIPKSIKIVCSDDVRPGTVVMTNPPQFACSDFNLAKAIIGTGITIGPDVNLQRIAHAVKRASRDSRVNRNSRINRNFRTNRDSMRLTETLGPRETYVNNRTGEVVRWWNKNRDISQYRRIKALEKRLEKLERANRIPRNSSYNDNLYNENSGAWVSPGRLDDFTPSNKERKW